MWFITHSTIPTTLRSALGFFTIYTTKQAAASIDWNCFRKWNFFDISFGLLIKSTCDWEPKRKKKNQETDIILKRSLSEHLSWLPLTMAIQQPFLDIRLHIKLFRALWYNSVREGNSTVLVNFVSTRPGHRVLRYLAKHYPGCSCRKLLDEINI